MKYKDKLLPIYLEETSDAIEVISNLLVELEQAPGNAEIVNELFRRVHTLKGSSSSIGFSTIATVAHKFETVLDEIRDGRIKLNEQVFANLFTATDVLRDLLDAAINGVDAGDIVHLADKLDAMIEGREKDKVDEEKNAPEEQQLALKIVLSDKCVMKQARVVVIFKHIRELGELVATEPLEPMLLSGQFDNTFSITVCTKATAEEICQRLGKIPDVVAVNVITDKEQQQDQTEARGKGRLRAPKMSVRVDVAKLENMINLVGELVIERNRLAAVINNLNGDGMEEDHKQALTVVSGQLGRITNELQVEIMNARMVPISHVFGNLPRLVRDTAHALGKKVNLRLHGEDTELDRTLVDRLRDPMVHLIRNAIDHGIELPEERRQRGKTEVGTLTVSARHQDNNIVIEVADDGKGINYYTVIKKVIDMGLRTAEELQGADEEELAELLFLPGFSTASQVSDISGRGVGLDAVRSELEAINGSITVQSSQAGTRFIIRLPMTLAIIQGLLFKVAGREFALPLTNILETLSINQHKANIIHGSEVIRLRGKIIPLVNVAKLLALPDDGAKKYILVVGVGENMMGLLVDNLIEKQDIVIKSLGSLFAENRELAGVTLLGNGLIVPILDAAGLFRLAGQMGHVDKNIAG